jgi:hypothetical protein
MVSKKVKHLMSQIQDLFDKWDQDTKDMKIERQKYWKQIAGDLVSKMVDDSDEALRGLSHPNANIRWVAIDIIMQYWRLEISDKFSFDLEEISQNDPVKYVRDLALMALGRYIPEIKDPHLGLRVLLARTVKDNNKSYSLRYKIYLELLTLSGKNTKNIIERNDMSSQHFRIPEDIDWDFVNSFIPPDDQT